jgi:hypothetical protein
LESTFTKTSSEMDPQYFQQLVYKFVQTPLDVAHTHYRDSTETHPRHTEEEEKELAIGCYGQSNIDLSEAANHWRNKKKETCASGNKYLCIVIMCYCTMVGTQI